MVRELADGGEELLTVIEAGGYFGGLAPMFGLRRSATARVGSAPTVVTGYLLRDFRAHRGDISGDLLGKAATRRGALHRDHPLGHRHRRHGDQGRTGRPRTGTLLAPRERILTPKPATPEAVADVVAQLAKHFDWTGSIGAAFPAVVKGGLVHTAANVDKSWVGTDAGELFARVAGMPVTVVNDADAAGLAEMEFGAAQGRTDTVVMLTLGTGIGSAVFLNGVLVPNTELGHLKIRGKDAERRAVGDRCVSATSSRGSSGRSGSTSTSPSSSACSGPT